MLSQSISEDDRMSPTREQSAAIQAILAVDGWCEKLPDSNCKVCPLLCFVDDANDVIARKAREWLKENTLAGQSIDQASETDAKADPPCDFPAR